MCEYEETHDFGPTDDQMLSWREHNEHADAADDYRDEGEDPLDRASCEHGGLLLSEDPDI